MMDLEHYVNTTFELGAASASCHFCAFFMQIQSLGAAPSERSNSLSLFGLRYRFIGAYDKISHQPLRNFRPFTEG
jgi:hypothetical protein